MVDWMQIMFPEVHAYLVQSPIIDRFRPGQNYFLKFLESLSR